MNAQSLVSIIKSADIAYEEGNFYGAARLYQDALKYNNRMYDIHYKAADAFRLDNDYVRAIKHYEIVSQKSLERFPLSIFYLAEMQKSDEDYFSAQFNFTKYYNKHSKDSTDYFTIRAKKEILNCEQAIRIKYNPTGVLIYQLDTAINSLYSEFATNTLTDSIMFLSSVKPLSNDSSFISHIYFSTYRNHWNPIKLFDTTINRYGFNTANPCYIPELNTLFFSSKSTNDTATSHIYRSTFIDGKWLGPFKLPNPINSNSFNSTQPQVTQWGSKYIMFYSSDNSAGIGGYDIWYVTMDNKFRFSEPKIAGIPPELDSIYIAYFGVESVINSQGNEITPFFDSKDSILYFSSDWFSGLGGYDIFNSHTDFTNWSLPENMGYPINSSQNDLYYNIASKPTKAYLTSNRKEALALKHQSCCNDIFYHEIPEVIDSVAIKEQQIISLTYEATQLVPITLYFHNDQPNPNCWDTITEMNYSETWEAYTKLEEEYIDAYTKGLAGNLKQASEDSITSFFNYEVTEEYKKLLKFAALLEELVKKEQQIIITIKGYTSPLNTSEYNENLAKRRTSSLMNFFREYKNGYFNEYEAQGIITYEEVGFGELLANPNVSDDPNDKRNSVYNPAAARERKIRIIAVSIKQNIE
jgi:hypothetical protein